MNRREFLAASAGLAMAGQAAAADRGRIFAFRDFVAHCGGDRC